MSGDVHFSKSRRGLARFAALAAVAIFTLGCGDSGPERVPVFPAKGKVIWNGQPVPGALVVLHPTSANQISARAQTEKDGTFKLSTYDTADGVPPGEYTVTVEWRKLIKDGGDYKAGPNVLPAKYSQAESSKLKVRIAEGANVLEPFTLTR